MKTPADKRAKNAAYMRKWRVSERGKAYLYAHHRSDQYKARKRRSEIKTTYGITLDEYEAKLAEQAGGCAICGKAPDIRRLAIDHCHTTGRIRGLLCAKHNMAVGILESDELDVLFAYIEKWKAIHRSDLKE